jgi:hypothetical protein
MSISQIHLNHLLKDIDNNEKHMNILIDGFTKPHIHRILCLTEKSEIPIFKNFHMGFDKKHQFNNLSYVDTSEMKVILKEVVEYSNENRRLLGQYFKLVEMSDKFYEGTGYFEQIFGCEIWNETLPCDIDNLKSELLIQIFDLDYWSIYQS